MKYFIKTYGCLMNHSDSERIAGVLELAGYKKTLQERDADLVVLNMCSVRESAVNRISGNFNKYKKYKKYNPNFNTVITGCVLESDKDGFAKLFDLVIDIKEIEKLPERLKFLSNEKKLTAFKTPQPPLSGGTNSAPDKEELIIPISQESLIADIGKISVDTKMILNQVQNDNTQIQNDKDTTNDYFSIAPQHESKITAFVPIMTGCNNFCSYCVVPYTRGREKSRTVLEILSEIQNLIENGYKEIILLGQNVNSYKSEIKNQESDISIDNSLKSKSGSVNWIPASAGMTEEIDFPKLLQLINEIPGNFWIRFMTSHPKDVSEELIKAISECEKCTEHIHLALQSGDDQILEIMNRKYTAEHFLSLVDQIRNRIPDISITTDIIVGFPSETEEQFQNTVTLMEKAKFDMAYINKYSPRTGTISARMKDNVSWEEKKRRENILTELLKKTALENNEKYVGKTIDMLIEKTDDDFTYGKSRSGKDVKVKLGIRNQKIGIKVGEFVRIKITKAKPWNLEGEIAE